MCKKIQNLSANSNVDDDNCKYFLILSKFDVSVNWIPLSGENEMVGPRTRIATNKIRINIILRMVRNVF